MSGAHPAHHPPGSKPLNGAQNAHPTRCPGRTHCCPVKHGLGRVCLRIPLAVIAGLDPAIQSCVDFIQFSETPGIEPKQSLDHRVKPGDDGGNGVRVAQGDRKLHYFSALSQDGGLTPDSSGSSRGMTWVVGVARSGINYKNWTR